ncbi:hypothetical protein JL720_5213 [Aureococcus anophagefferens]|nr:hypothetical protein JL720_5213 [Aureococcus anophagefferens]
MPCARAPRGRGRGEAAAPIAERKAFGTLVSQIEVKLLATAAEERDKADKADKALVAGSGLGDRLGALESARPGPEARLLEDRTAAQASRVAAAERERDELRAALAEARAGLSVATEGSFGDDAATGGSSRPTAERDAARARPRRRGGPRGPDGGHRARRGQGGDGVGARDGGARLLVSSDAAGARGVADEADQRRFSELEVARHDEQDKVSAAVAACDANVASAVGGSAQRPRREASVASHADALQALRSELAASEAERDRLGEASARADGGAAETRGARDAEAARLRASSTARRDGRGPAAAPRGGGGGGGAAATCEGRVAEMEEKLRDADVTRRKLHNTIQGRGNIRVLASRPFLPAAAPDAPPVVVDMADGTSLTLAAEDDDADGEPFGDKKRKRRKELFSYDHVFGPSTGQERVFTEVAEFVQSALDGYQVCLFSYGQTGSGKTHTMQGTGTGPMRGIIPRAMEQVAAYCDAQRARGWAYEMEVSYVEIYNEQVRDLLADNGPAPAPGGDVRPEARGPRGPPRPKAGVYVDGCTRTPVDPGDKAMVDDLMQCAATHRCKKARLKGALNLVDLAGSERLDRSGAVGQRAKEAAHINKSLSALAGVFSALNRKQTHVPYRDSKLTFLLQPALSGDGKTLLFVNLSPTPGSANESLCSLRFAKQVQSVELGKAKRHIETVH